MAYSIPSRVLAFAGGAALGYAAELLWRGARAPEGAEILLNVGMRDLVPFILPAAIAAYLWPGFVLFLFSEWLEYEEERHERRAERFKVTLSVLFYAALMIVLFVGFIWILMRAVKL